jgi:hypothetical protein
VHRHAVLVGELAHALGLVGGQVDDSLAVQAVLQVEIAQTEVDLCLDRAVDVGPRHRVQHRESHVSHRDPPLSR